MDERNHFSLSERAAIARRQAKQLALSQEELADRLGLSQPQVSRMLSGKLTRETRPFLDLCAYVNETASGSTSARQLPEAIRSAALEVWDGTPSHALAISTVIRALLLLRPLR